jgi:hypothetical protein
VGSGHGWPLADWGDDLSSSGKDENIREAKINLYLILMETIKILYRCESTSCKLLVHKAPAPVYFDAFRVMIKNRKKSISSNPNKSISFGFLESTKSTKRLLTGFFVGVSDCR